MVLGGKCVGGEKVRETHEVVARRIVLSDTVPVVTNILEVRDTVGRDVLALAQRSYSSQGRGRKGERDRERVEEEHCDD